MLAHSSGREDGATRPLGRGANLSNGLPLSLVTSYVKGSALVFSFKDAFTLRLEDSSVSASREYVEETFSERRPGQGLEVSAINCF